LDLLREGNASQLLDVLLAPQVHVRHSKFCLGVVDPLRDFFIVRARSARSLQVTEHGDPQAHSLR
jgi:hypothetical protein